MLVGVGVAEHHLLQVTPQCHQPAIRPLRQQLVEDRPGGGHFLRRLEKRHEANIGNVGVQIDEAGLPGKNRRSQHIVGAARLGDDVTFDYRRAKPDDRPPDRGECGKCRGGGAVQWGCDRR